VVRGGGNGRSTGNVRLAVPGASRDERQGRAMVSSVIILLFIDIFWWLKR